jgi:hypothetical protein
VIHLGGRVTQRVPRSLRTHLGCGTALNNVLQLHFLHLYQDCLVSFLLIKSGATHSRRPSDSGPDHWPDHLRRRNVGWISFAFVMGGHVTLCFLCFVDTLVLNWACSSCYLHCKKLGTHHFITSKD